MRANDAGATEGGAFTRRSLGRSAGNMRDAASANRAASGSGGKCADLADYLAGRRIGGGKRMKQTLLSEVAANSIVQT